MRLCFFSINARFFQLTMKALEFFYCTIRFVQQVSIDSSCIYSFKTARSATLREGLYAGSAICGPALYSEKSSGTVIVYCAGCRYNARHKDSIHPRAIARVETDPELPSCCASLRAILSTDEYLLARSTSLPCYIHGGKQLAALDAREACLCIKSAGSRL